ncbi:MAG: arginyltransferase [Phycisphaerales bacterium]|nr:arginyltransferase [Phycisphaerales bacterium]
MNTYAILFHMETAGNTDRLNFSLPLFRGDPHPCPYLPGHTADNELTLVPRIDGAVYERLMDLGFRRSGDMLYRPACEGCSECVPLRVPVTRFKPSRSQRRVRRRNQDVVVETGSPISSDEKWRIYKAYLSHQHDGTMSDRREDFEQFLYNSPTKTEEMVYRIGRRIVGVGIVDVCPTCLSSVYFYFDPTQARRSLGVFSTLMEIQVCHERNIPYWYAGFYIRACGSMSYKADFRPYELLGPDGVWRTTTTD